MPSDKKNEWTLPIATMLIGIALSCSVGYFGFQRVIESRISVLETQIKTQTEELGRQRDVIASTIEPRLRGIETQLSAIRALLERR